MLYRCLAVLAASTLERAHLCTAAHGSIYPCNAKALPYCPPKVTQGNNNDNHSKKTNPHSCRNNQNFRRREVNQCKLSSCLDYFVLSGHSSRTEESLTFNLGDVVPINITAPSGDHSIYVMYSESCPEIFFIAVMSQTSNTPRMFP